jgi:2-dehydropantoate 2-reductase
MAGILPLLSDLRRSPDVLFFGNALGQTESLSEALGKPAMFGFPGAGGIRDGAVIRYVLIPQQKTMLGEPEDGASTRVRHLQSVFREAGLPTTISENVEGWLTAHSAFIVPIACAPYRCDTDASRLADDPSALEVMVRATRQAFLRAAGHRQRGDSDKTSRSYTCGCRQGSLSATGDACWPDPAVSCGSLATAELLARI